MLSKIKKIFDPMPSALKRTCLWVFVAISAITFGLFFIPFLQVLTLKIPASGQPVPETAYMAERKSTAFEMKSGEWTELKNISPLLICAVVKAEDRKFFSHNGFDWPQMYKAMRLALENPRSMGGSTITQQLARNLFLSSERSFVRKAREFIYAFWLEVIYSKTQILTIYLNSIEWGHRIWGISEAAQFYFSKPAKNLNVGQSMLLASLIASPRKIISGQLPRVRSVYNRLTNQFYFSDITNIGDMYASRTTFSEFLRGLEENPDLERALKIFENAPDVEHFTYEMAVDEGCGLRTELRRNEAFLRKLPQ